MENKNRMRYIARKKAAPLTALLLAAVMLLSSGCGVRNGNEPTALPATDEPVVINSGEPVNTEDAQGTDVATGDATDKPETTPESTEVLPTDAATEAVTPAETAAAPTETAPAPSCRPLHA